MQVLLPPGWPRPRGYANGVAATGRMVFVAGMIGWDEQGQFHTDDFAGQVRQALLNVVAVLQAGGGITLLSEPGPEYEETLTKAARVFQAFEA